MDNNKNIVLDMSEFESEINTLERLHYEIDARTRIINLMISEGNSEYNDTFNKYWETYLEYIKAYNVFKERFYENHLSEYKEGTWELDFMSKQVTIYTEN